MKTYYICGYLRNADGTVRKDAKRHVLAIAHSPDEIKKKLKLETFKYGIKYDIRVFDGQWKEIESHEEE